LDDYKVDVKKKMSIRFRNPAFIYNIDSDKYKGSDPDIPITVNYRIESIDLHSEESSIRDELINFTFESGDFNIGK
jgi:hypothetical protein